MKAINTFVFDMDGTLLDSMGSWQNVDTDIIAELGIPTEKVDFDMLITYGLGRLLDAFRRDFNIEISEEEFEELAMSRMKEWYKNEARLLPGAKETLNMIEEMGYPIAVATATPRDMAISGLKTCGIFDQIDLLYSASEDNFSKNDRRYFKTLQEKLKKSPENLVLFDDALYSVVTAKECGWYTVGVRDDSYPQDWDQILRQADETIEGFAHFNPRKWLADKTKLADKIK